MKRATSGLSWASVDAVARYLAEQPEVRVAYLFGSQASRTAVEGSDVDVAVVARPPLSPRRLEEVRSGLSAALGGLPVDLVDLARASIELRYNAVCGRRVFARDEPERVEYEATVYSLYCDALPTLRRQRDELLRREGYARGVQRHREAFAAARRERAATGGTPGPAAG